MTDDRRTGSPDRRSNFMAAAERYIRDTPSLRRQLLAPLFADLALLEETVRDMAVNVDLGDSGSQAASALDDIADRIRQVRKVHDEQLGP